MFWKSIGNWQQRRTVDLSEFGWHLSSEPEITRTNTILRRVGSTSAIVTRKIGNIPNGSEPAYVSKSNKTRLKLTRREGKDAMTRGRMASERQINRLPGLLAVKMIWQHISLTNRLAHLPTTLPIIGGNDPHSRLKSWYHSWGAGHSAEQTENRSVTANSVYCFDFNAKLF